MSDQPRTTIVGEPPWFPSLAELMEPAPELLDDLATDFAPMAAGMDPQAYWTSFHCYVVDRLVGAAMGDREDPAPLRAAAWAIYATSYWTAVSWTQAAVTGEVVGINELGLAGSSVTEDSLAALVGPLAANTRALDGDLDLLLEHVDDILRQPAQAGALYGTAYNTGYLIVIGEAPPIGERPPHLSFETGSVRADADHLLELDYAEPLPDWLARRRAVYARTAADEPERLANIIAGNGAEPDLRDMWGEAFAQGIHNWGGDSIKGWTQDFFDPFFRWSVVYNYGLEATSRAALVALTLDDEGAALDAIKGNLLYACSWGGFMPGAMDTTGRLPDVKTA